MLFADVGAAAAAAVAAAVDTVAVVDCNIVEVFVVDGRTDYSVGAADVAVGHDEHDIVVAVAAVVADDECIGDDAEIVAAAAVDDTRANTAVVNCRICCDVRRCYRHCLQQDDMGFRLMLLPCSFADVDYCCCCRCYSLGEEVHYTVVGICQWTRALLADSNHWFATLARSNCEIHCFRYNSSS